MKIIIGYGLIEHLCLTWRLDQPFDYNLVVHRIHLLLAYRSLNLRRLVRSLYHWVKLTLFIERVRQGGHFWHSAKNDLPFVILEVCARPDALFDQFLSVLNLLWCESHTFVEFVCWEIYLCGVVPTALLAERHGSAARLTWNAVVHHGYRVAPWAGILLLLSVWIQIFSLNNSERWGLVHLLQRIHSLILWVVLIWTRVLKELFRLTRHQLRM